MSQSKQLRYAMGVNQILCLDSGSHGKRPHGARRQGRARQRERFKKKIAKLERTLSKKTYELELARNLLRDWE